MLYATHHVYIQDKIPYTQYLNLGNRRYTPVNKVCWWARTPLQADMLRHLWGHNCTLTLPYPLLCSPFMPHTMLKCSLWDMQIDTRRRLSSRITSGLTRGTSGGSPQFDNDVSEKKFCFISFQIWDTTEFGPGWDSNSQLQTHKLYSLLSLRRYLDYKYVH